MSDKHIVCLLKLWHDMPLFLFVGGFMTKRFFQLFTFNYLTLALSLLSWQTANAQTSKPNTPDIDKVMQCADVLDNTARLACFDKVVNNQAVLNQKAPLDIAKTVTTSIKELKPTVVLADEKITEQSMPTWVDDNVTQPIVEKSPEKDKQILASVGVNDDDFANYSPLSVLFDLDRNDPKGILTLRPHQPMYVLPSWYSLSPNYDVYSPVHGYHRYAQSELDSLDAKMQLSFKTKIAEDLFDTNADIWAGYTQQFYWQVYNNKQSRPFRSSDYQPEIFITQPVKADLPVGGKLRMLGAGMVHQSNGQSEPLSRSWNRAYLMAGAEFGKFTVVPRVWLIGGEEKDNPDIEDYMGYGDIRWGYDLQDNRTIGGFVRYNPSTQKGAVQVDYAYPLLGGMKMILQVFHGYGENIQDYNHKSTNLGIGLMFNDFKGL